MTFVRKRKTKDPCSECFLHKDLCICDQIPVLDLKTKIVLIIHAKELKRTTNTGRLALKALSNSVMKVRGELHKQLDLRDLLVEDYDTLLFYPSKDAVDLTPEFLKQFKKPIQLLVPDGNWRQASKVHTRQPELKAVPRVMISKPNNNPLHLRVETTEEGMATLEAIAEALRVIEGEEVFEKIQKVYLAKLENTLKGRGQLA